MTDVNEGQIDPNDPENQPAEGQGEGEGLNPDGTKPDDGPKVDPEQVETQKKIREGLSQISKIYNNSGLAYINLNISEKEIKKLYDILNDYPYLRYVNLSKNEIENIECVGNIPYLLSLNASNNLINSMEMFCNHDRLTFLQFLNLSNTKITKLPAIALPRLRKLYLNECEITSCEGFQEHSNIEILELRRNKLKNCKGLHKMVSLTYLDLSENEITNFQDLNTLTSLETLILKSNKLTKLRLPLPNLPSINHFDCSENAIVSYKEFLKFKYWLSVRSVTVTPNPCEDASDLRKEILMNFLHFTKVDEQEVTQEEREDIIREKEERRLQEEEERKQKEAEEEEARRIKEEEEKAERERLEEERRIAEEEQAKIDAAEKAKAQEAGGNAEGGNPEGGNPEGGGQ